MKSNNVLSVLPYLFVWLFSVGIVAFGAYLSTQEPPPEEWTCIDLFNHSRVCYLDAEDCYLVAASLEEEVLCVPRAFKK